MPTSSVKPNPQRPGLGGTLRWRQRTGTLERVDPGAFLRAAQGEARGFWASGSRWIAHAGALRQIRIPGAPERGQGSLARVVEEESRKIFGSGDGGYARVFGGMAFSGERSLDELWRGFPSALFLLPEVEVEHLPEKGLCRITARAATSEAAERKRRRWTKKLEAALGADACGGEPRGEERPYRIRRMMEPPRWRRMVERVLERIRTGEAHKVVLARALEVSGSPSVDSARLATALWEENPGSRVFLFEPAPTAALVGAAPETIATMAGGTLRASAVAGSRKVGADSVETARLARDLITSPKERAEHAFVVDDVVARLRELGCRVRRDVEPHVLALARIQHLESNVFAEPPPGVSLLKALERLHPTPAVCGIPRSAALSIVAQSETLDRGWYAGPVGWLGSDGSGIFVPALRSAVSNGRRWRLYAGAGIVRGSRPRAEWDETELKFRPVLQAIERVSRARP